MQHARTVEYGRGRRGQVGGYQKKCQTACLKIGSWAWLCPTALLSLTRCLLPGPLLSPIPTLLPSPCPRPPATTGSRPAAPSACTPTTRSRPTARWAAPYAVHAVTPRAAVHLAVAASVLECTGCTVGAQPAPGRSCLKQYSKACPSPGLPSTARRHPCRPTSHWFIPILSQAKHDWAPLNNRGVELRKVCNHPLLSYRMDDAWMGGPEVRERWRAGFAGVGEVAWQ